MSWLKKITASSKLHIGAGDVILPGWVNIDIANRKGINRVLDVRRGLPFYDVQFIFAEHFIEHLEFEEGLNFLRECRRVLAPSGVLRISTPNLDWVWVTQYHYAAWHDGSEAIRDCFWSNRGFHGWGHKFLYNAPTLIETLGEAGFGTFRLHKYGESELDELRRLEHHEKSADTQDLPHVVIVEASGNRQGGSQTIRDHLADYREAQGAKHVTGIR